MSPLSILNNQIQLIGRAGHDVELVRMTDGTCRAELRLYQRVPLPGRDDEQQVHKVVAWRGVAEQLYRQCKRGDRLLVQGRLINRKFTYGERTEVRSEVHLLQFTVLYSRSQVADADYATPA